MDKTVSFGFLDLASESLLQILEYLTVANSCSFVTCNKSTAELKTLYPNFVLWEISAAINEMTAVSQYKQSGPLARTWTDISGIHQGAREYKNFWPRIIDYPLYRVLVDCLGPETRSARHYELLMIFVDEVRGCGTGNEYVFIPYAKMDAPYKQALATMVTLNPRFYVDHIFAEVLYTGSMMGPLGHNDDCMTCGNGFGIRTLHCTEQDVMHIRIGYLLAENQRVRQLHYALVQYIMCMEWSISGYWPPVSMEKSVVDMLQSKMSSGTPICEEMGFFGCNHQHECGFFFCPGMVFGKEYTGPRTNAEWICEPKRDHSKKCKKILDKYAEIVGSHKPVWLG